MTVARGAVATARKTRTTRFLKAVNLSPVRRATALAWPQIKPSGNMDNQSLHTPGPWKLTGLSRRGFYVKVRGTRLGAKFEVANCPFVPDSLIDKIEAEANARLIADAPDLLAALQQCQKVLSEIITTDPFISARDAFLMARIAEARARAVIAHVLAETY